MYVSVYFAQVRNKAADPTAAARLAPSGRSVQDTVCSAAKEGPVTNDRALKVAAERKRRRAGKGKGRGGREKKKKKKEDPNQANK